MITIVHRVNTINQLNKVNKNEGVEVDVRCFKDNLILHHDPFKSGERFEDYLEVYDNELLILNIKESGIENEIIEHTKKKLGDKKFFLLDTEIPYIVLQSGKYKEYISARYSEYETFDSLVSFKNLADWVWIDTFSNLPKIDDEIIAYLKTKKTCLVSPERWGRKDELEHYLNIFNDYGYKPDYVMK